MVDSAPTMTLSARNNVAVGRTTTSLCARTVDVSAPPPTAHRTAPSETGEQMLNIYSRTSEAILNKTPSTPACAAFSRRVGASPPQRELEKVVRDAASASGRLNGI